jgi:RNA polymerase sigma factor (sigma-70 family)
MDASVLPGHPAYVRRSRAALRLASDKRLAALVRTGETVAFEVLYDRHAHKLLSFCRHMLGSRQDGEDALQRTFASAYRALLVDEREIELRPWLFAIARNECLSILRQRNPTGELGDAEPATDGLSSRVEDRDDLRNVLADLRALPERQRAALLLSELGGFTHAQIAQAVGARPEQIKAYVFQARSNLIAERDARENSCLEVRAQLTSSRGAALLQRELSRHLRRCRDCRDYSAALRRQRRALAIVLPVAPSLALRSAVLRTALGSAQGAGASSGVAGAGLAQAGLAEAGVALADTGGDALLSKGLAVIACAALSAGAGTLALHGASSHHPRAAAPPSAKAGSPDRTPASEHLVAPARSRWSPTILARPLGRAVVPAERSDVSPPGGSGRVAASGTRASTSTRAAPTTWSAPAANSHNSGAGARPPAGLVPWSVGATQRDRGNSPYARGPERGDVNGDATKERAGGRGAERGDVNGDAAKERAGGRGAERGDVNSDAAKERAAGRARSKSGSPAVGRSAHAVSVGSEPPGTAGSTAAAEPSNSQPPGHAYGAEPSDSTAAGDETGAGSDESEAPGNSASAPGHSR